VVTDSDVKERGALANVWPDIHLLLCLFHTKKAWRKKFNKCLGSGGSADVVARRAQVRKFLDGLLDRYARTV
jgi:hypothetical protein